MARVSIALPEHFIYATEIQVRIGDTNYGGHLGNDALLSLIHEARVRFFSALGFSEMDVAGSSIIMADSSILYESEAFAGERLRFEISTADLQAKGCDIVYRVTHVQSGRAVAVAKTGIVFFDYAQRTVLPMPQAFRDALGALRPLAA